MERKECHAEGKTIICIPKKKTKKQALFQQEKTFTGQIG
jgi:hypothetical protein